MGFPETCYSNVTGSSLIDPGVRENKSFGAMLVSDISALLSSDVLCSVFIDV